MKEIPNGMGTWLAVFDHNGDLAGSISQRPNLMPILDILEENGDEIIENCDSIVAEIDMDKEIIKKLVQLCENTIKIVRRCQQHEHRSQQKRSSAEI